MKNKNNLIFGLIIAVLISYFTFRNIVWREFINSFAKVDFIYLLPSILIPILNFVARVYRWQVLLQPLKEFKTSKLLSPLMVGYMGNLLPARAGDFYRAWLRWETK